MRNERAVAIGAALAALSFALGATWVLVASRDWESPWLRTLRLPAAVGLVVVAVGLILLTVPAVRRWFQGSTPEVSPLPVPEALERAAEAQAGRAGAFIDRVGTRACARGSGTSSRRFRMTACGKSARLTLLCSARSRPARRR